MYNRVQFQNVRMVQKFHNIFHLVAEIAIHTRVFYFFDSYFYTSIISFRDFRKISTKRFYTFSGTPFHGKNRSTNGLTLILQGRLYINTVRYNFPIKKLILMYKPKLVSFAPGTFRRSEELFSISLTTCLMLIRSSGCLATILTMIGAAK